VGELREAVAWGMVSCIAVCAPRVDACVRVFVRALLACERAQAPAYNMLINQRARCCESGSLTERTLFCVPRRSFRALATALAAAALLLQTCVPSQINIDSPPPLSLPRIGTGSRDPHFFGLEPSRQYERLCDGGGGGARVRVRRDFD
jgi:hypothetical protein